MTHPMDFSMILNSSEDDNDNISSPEESEEDDSGKSHDGRADTMHFDTILHPSQNSKSSYADQQRPNHDVQTASKDNSTSFSFEPEKPSLFSPMEWNLEARKLPRPSSMLEQPDIGDYFRSTQKYETQSLIGRTQALHVRSSTTESRQVSRSNSTHDVSQEMHPVKMEVPRQPNGNGYYASERLYEPHYLDRPHVFDRKGSSPEFWRSGRGSPTLQSEASSNLPSLKRETSQPPNFIGYSGPEEGSETPTQPQGSHIPNPILDSRKPVRRSSSHGEPRGVQKHHRALPTRTILPQTRRNDGMISQRGQRDARTSSGRSCSYPGGELISPSQYFGRTKTSKAKPAHSNKAYTPEQVHWIRYMKEDCKHAWKALPTLFAFQFPDEQGFDTRISDQCFSSRGYRDNRRPLVNEKWNLMFDEDGKVVMIDAKVRERSTAEGMALDYPFTLVELHPRLAIQYSWVSDEHKAMARKILMSPSLEGNKEKWRKLWRYIEDNDLQCQ